MRNSADYAQGFGVYRLGAPWVATIITSGRQAFLAMVQTAHLESVWFDFLTKRRRRSQRRLRQQKD